MLFVVLQTLIGFGRKGENLPKMLSTEIALCPAAPHFVRQGSAVSISVYAFCIIFFFSIILDIFCYAFCRFANSHCFW